MIPIHTTYDRTPYTYHICWSNLNIHYYGVKYSKECHPSDLWTTYFTSSTYVQEFRNNFGEPDIIQVRKIFDNVNKARDWEYKVLRRLNVINDEKWLNKSDGSNNFGRYGNVTNETRQKMRDGQLKRGPVSEETKQKISKNHRDCKKEKNAFWNKQHTEETKQKMKEAKKNIDSFTRLKMSFSAKKRINEFGHNMKGKSHSEETKQKISDSLKGKSFKRYSTINKNKHKFWFNNGINEIKSLLIPDGDDWIKGRLNKPVPPKAKGKKWFNNGIINCMSIEIPGQGWITGKLTFSTEPVFQMNKSVKGSNWFNNGFKSIRRKEHPGEGWYEGRIKR
jgi:hypothetical protein